VARRPTKAPPTQAPPARPVAHRAPDAGKAGPRFLPLFAWVGALGAIAVLGTLALVLLIRNANLRNVAQGPATVGTAAVGAVAPEGEVPRPDPEVNDPWEPAPNQGVAAVHTEEEYKVDPVGDAVFTGTIKLAPKIQATFKRLVSRPDVEAGVLKWREPKIATVLRALDLETAGSVQEGLEGAFEGDAIRARCREVGWAKQRGGRWVCQLTTERKNVYRLTRKAYQDGVPTVTFRALIDGGGVQQTARLQVTLPRGAHDIRVENEPNQLVYRAPAPAKGGGTGRPTLHLQTKPHVMSALYKLYGDRRFHKLWVARALFRNTGGEVLTDYRVRFRLAGYSEWSRWETCDVVHPGQTVVDPFYPIIDARRVRELQGATPVDVQVEHSYVRPGGEKVSDSSSERTRLLGMNEGVYSDIAVDRDSSWYEMFKDAPLVLASFTSANDPVILDVVARLGWATRGTGTSLNDKEAITFLRALYDLMRANIKYETTPGNRIDGLLHQHLKYGRDVLRYRSGTCVNTAIFYASVVEAAGLDAFIFVIEGHAFAGARLPSGKLLPVETTKATRGDGAPFEVAVEEAGKTFAEASAVGLILPVDIRWQRQRGVTPPELPDAGKDPLKEWGIVTGPQGGPPGRGSAEKTAEEHCQEGKEHAEKNRWAEAAACFTRAIERDGTKSEYYSKRCNAFISLGDAARKAGDEKTSALRLRQAADDVVKAVELDPKNTNAWNNAGVVFSRIDERRQALKYFTRAIELDPRNARAYRNRGITYAKLGDQRRAQADLDRAKELER
jgi:tetratricopeptide (TPR) repeat protein